MNHSQNYWIYAVHIGPCPSHASPTSWHNVRFLSQKKPKLQDHRHGAIWVACLPPPASFCQ